MTIFKAMLTIRDIDNKKAADKIKEEEKQARREALGLLPEPEEEVKEEVVTKAKTTGGKKKKVVEPDPEELEARRQKEALEKDIAEYGRTWVWEGYFNLEEHRTNWMEGAERLRHINPQILEDIEDYILLDGFKGQKDIKKTPEDIEAKI